MRKDRKLATVLMISVAAGVVLQYGATLVIPKKENVPLTSTPIYRPRMSGEIPRTFVLAWSS